MQVSGLGLHIFVSQCWDSDADHSLGESAKDVELLITQVWSFLVMFVYPPLIKHCNGTSIYTESFSHFSPSAKDCPFSHVCLDKLRCFCEAVSKFRFDVSTIEFIKHHRRFPQIRDPPNGWFISWTLPSFEMDGD